MRTLIIMSVLLSGCAVNGEWTRQDTILEVSFQVVNAMDAVTTSRIHESPDWHPVEINGVPYRRRLEESTALTRAVLGPRPSKSDTYMWFATLGLSHWIIARSLPPKWRPWYQGATIGLSSDAVIGNCDNGLC